MVGLWIVGALLMAGLAFTLGGKVGARPTHRSPSRPPALPSVAAALVPPAGAALLTAADEAPVDGLAAVVREAKLELQNAELRLILDTVDQGFLMVQLDGRLLPERSKIVTSWFGPLPPGASFWDVVEQIEPRSRAWAKHGWQQVVAGLLPLEAALAQLPTRLRRERQYFEIAYHPVVRDEALQRVVVVLTDVTQSVERQKTLGEQRDFSILVERFVKDRRGFLEFWSEASRLFERLIRPSAASTGTEARRDLHTLKGSLSFLGLLQLASACHDLEDALRERSGDELSEAERKELAEAWGALATRIAPLLERDEDTFDVSAADHARLAQAVAEGRPQRELVELVGDLKLRPTAGRLAWARDHLKRVTRQLGKTPPEVTLLDHGVRLPVGSFSAFWNVFVHVLNNAADHGVESDEARRARGKPVPARVALATELQGSELIVEVRDDGPGIDWDKLRQRARELQLPHDGHEALVQALFMDGLSSTAEVSEVSGRGVGLAAVRSVVNAVGGAIEVVSAESAGTCLRIRLPLPHR